MENADFVAKIGSSIKESTANNSRLYEVLRTSASLQQVFDFLCWDAQQPSFKSYLEGWLSKAPSEFKVFLEEHIVEETGHSRLFSNMLNSIEKMSLAKPPEPMMHKLDDLNYTFSQRCVEEQSFSFFIGSFWATEIMSAKRCRQVYEGLRRCGVEDDVLEYLHIHMELDEEHGKAVEDQLVLTTKDEDKKFIEKGVFDRLERSHRYLEWYAGEFL